MKKLSIVFVALLTVLLIGCKGEQKVREKSDENPNLIKPAMTLSKMDTVQVRRLTVQFLDCLEKRDLNGAMSMLRYYEHDSIKALPLELAQKESMVLGMFLGNKAEIDHIIFYKDDDSEVKYTMTLFERTDPNDRRPNKASFLIRPVRHEGKWYLTLADTKTDKVKSEIRH